MEQNKLTEEEVEELKFREQFVTENKKQKIEQVLQNRTKYITVGLEDIYHPQDASAVLRTCDCFGIQEAHIIENRNTYKINPDVTHGSEKWVDIIKHNGEHNQNTSSGINYLKNQGYKIVATTLEDYDVELENLDIDKPLAVFFGAEAQGVSQTTKNMADIRMKIPMYGFTQSFNISVSAAIILYQLTQKIRNATIPWKLTAEEQDKIRLHWYQKITNFKWNKSLKK